MYRRALKWTLWTLAALSGAMVVTFFVLANGHTVRGPLTHYFEAKTGRQIRIDGPLELHLFSRHPTAIAHHVVVGNPPWSGPGNLAEIDTLTVMFDLPSLEIHRLELAGATLSFQRDKSGHGNWLWEAPGILPGDKGLPVIHDLAIPGARLVVADDRRHLQFEGTLSTHNAATDPLHLTAKGQLNGHDVTIVVAADPLAAASRAKPYHFTFDERSSGAHLDARGALTHAYDLRYVDADFAGSGGNLRDSYYLVGTQLPNTGSFRVSGKFARRNTILKLSDVVTTTGASDARANITSRLDNGGHSHIDIDLSSRRLQLADLGVGRQEAADAQHPATLPATPLHLDVLRDKDISINLEAEELDFRKFTFQMVTAKAAIANGTITLPQLTGKLADRDTPAKITAHAELDGQVTTPRARLHLSISNLRLGQFARKDPTHPPVDGLLQVGINLSGHGRSVRELATSADGTVTATLPQGTIRASLAELAGMDLRGLGLILARNKNDTAIRCGVASFKAHDGTLTAESLVLDTDPVLITGEGTIQLDTQALDLLLQGHPKGLRILRLSAPVAIQGTFTHPTFHIEGHKKLQLVDTGHAKDADCGSLLAEAKATAPASR